MLRPEADDEPSAKRSKGEPVVNDQVREKFEEMYPYLMECFARLRQKFGGKALVLQSICKDPLSRV